MMIYIGSDHRGFLLKEKIIKWLFDEGHKVFDVGADHLDPDDDYTRYAQEVASLVANNKNSLGILLCGSGVGVDVVANKFDRIRASIGKNSEQIKAGRNDDDMNVLVIAADYTKEDEAIDMVDVFLKTPFARVLRFRKRLRDIGKLEANN